MPAGVLGQRWGKAAAPAAHLSLQGTRLWGLSCGDRGEFCQRLPHPVWAWPWYPWAPIFPLAEWEGVPSHDVRTDRHRKYKVLGRNRYLAHPPGNPAISKLMGKGPCTYANFLIYKMSGHLDLLRNSPDGEYSQVGVGVGRWVPLKLYVGS